MRLSRGGKNVHASESGLTLIQELQRSSAAGNGRTCQDTAATSRAIWVRGVTMSSVS